MNEKISRRGLFKRAASFGAVGLGALVAGCVGYYQQYAYQPAGTGTHFHPNKAIFICNEWVDSDGDREVDVGEYVPKICFGPGEQVTVIGFNRTGRTAITCLKICDAGTGEVITQSPEMRNEPGNGVSYRTRVEPGGQRTRLVAYLLLDGHISAKQEFDLVPNANRY